MGPERRRNPRVAVNGKGSNGVVRGALPVRLHDISAGGLRFGVPVSLEPGTIHSLTALLGGLSLAAPIRITRCGPGDGPSAPGPGWEAGAEFLWRDDADAIAVRKWLEGRPPGRA